MRNYGNIFNDIKTLKNSEELEKKARLRKSQSNTGQFKNYVNRILPLFDHLTTLSKQYQ